MIYIFSQPLGGTLRIGPKKDKNELFKKAYDEALDKNTYEIRFCDLISASLKNTGQREVTA